MRRVLLPLLILIAVVSAACNDGGGSGDGPLVVYSGRNENLVRPLLEEFARESGVDISVRYGDTSELAPTILEEGGNTRADVFFSQDAGALAALGDAGLFRKLPTSLLNKVDSRFRDPDGRWTGVTARARVIAYNTDKLKEQDLPPSALALTEPAWKGRVGIAPTNASFVAYVSALIEEVGEPRARQFLEGLKANGVKEYDNNVLILDAIASGEIDVGLVNHYYLYGEFKERPDAPVANFYPGQGTDGEGTFINVAGVGILENTDKAAQAQQFVEFLLDKRGQEYFRDETTEYPLASGVEAIDELPPIADLKTIDVPLDRLGTDLSGSLELIKDVGLT
jgi:iron(III) transport system substrate-binding protein